MKSLEEKGKADSEKLGLYIKLDEIREEGEKKRKYEEERSAKLIRKLEDKIDLMEKGAKEAKERPFANCKQQ